MRLRNNSDGKVFDVGFVMIDALAPDDYFRDLRWLIGGLGELGLKTALLTWKSVKGRDATDGLPSDTAIFDAGSSAAFGRQCRIVHHFGSIFTFASLRTAVNSSNALLVQSLQSHLMHNAIHHRSTLRKQIYLRAIQPWLKKVHLLHCYSDIEHKRSALPGCLADKDYFVGNLGVFPEPVYQDDVRLESVQGDFVVLFFGRNDVQHKGLHILIDSFELFHDRIAADERRKPLLVIAGRGREEDLRWLDNRLAQSNAPILRLGECSERERAALYERANVFVFPTRHDGPPRPIREALMRGCAVLVSSESNMADVVELNSWGKGFELRPEELAGRLGDLFTQPEVLRGYRDSTRSVSVALSWKAVAHDYLAGYEKGLKRYSDASLSR